MIRHWLKTVVLAGALALSAQLSAAAREVVPFGRDYAAGSVVIVTHARELYYVIGQGQAIRYPVGVGKAGMAWHGRAFVALKTTRPAWQAPPELGVRPGYSGRFAAQSHGRRGVRLESRQLRHPRHQRSLVDRRLRLPRLHPHA